VPVFLITSEYKECQRISVESNEIWQKVKMHGISLERYIGRNTDGGLEKLRREIQAENEGIVIV